MQRNARVNLQINAQSNSRSTSQSNGRSSSRINVRSNSRSTSQSNAWLNICLALSFFVPMGVAIADQTWTYTYNANGQVLTADGPRTGVGDVTVHSYDASSNLSTTTSALDHVTLLQDYNGRGQAGKIIDPNGVETLLSYHARGWLLTSTVKDPDGDAVLDAITTYGYDKVGQVIRITLPEGAVLNYEYNGAHQLTAVSNGLGERIEYTLDLEGNHTGETLKSDIGDITKTLTRSYDELSRLLAVVGAGGQTTTYKYDTNGNITRVIDGRLNRTDMGYDALNRLVTDDAPLNHSVDYFYDGQDNLVQVTDPTGRITAYSYGAFGNLKQLDSPDTGITDYTYDSANNRLSQTDYKGVVTNYTYDALNRLLTINYPNNALNIAYTYDQGTYGRGRLTGISDGSGTTSLGYDHRGNLISHSTVFGASSYTLSYAYNLTNQLIQVTYPSGRSVDYAYDVAGFISGVDTTFDAATQSLASNFDYLPFGPLNQFDYGNGIQLTGTYDADYRLDLLSHGAIKQTDYGYDNTDNITSILDNTDSSADQGFTYDALNRLTNATGIYGDLSYSYDENGNRLSFTDSTGTDTYTYDASNHRLLSTNNWDYRYDANGNRISKFDSTGVGDGLLYSYDDQNRLIEVIERKTTTSGRGKRNTVTTQTDTIVASYTYNAFGQRVTKITPNQTTYYVYGPSGQLMSELDAQGTALRDYLFVNGQPLAVVDYQQTQQPPSSGQEVVIDNGDGGTSHTGTWASTKSRKAYNGSYELSNNIGNTYRWTPSNLSNADYQVYARWPGVKQHNTAAQYTISHNGQTTGSGQNQSKNGKQWVLLGTYTFSGNGGEYIELSDLGGKTAADAIRLVEISTEPPPTLTASVYYSHNDHLGTPQVFTDTNQNIVWQADYRSFGEVSESVNIIANNLRFPGQYFDEESNLHYNYFRDYDPTTGRYVQSDPIGLAGGLSTYGYVYQNPLRYTDPTGLVVQAVTVPAGAVVGAIGGASGAFIGTYFFTDGSFSDAVSAASTGLWQGAIIGAVAGACGGCVGGVVTGLGLGWLIVGANTLEAINPKDTKEDNCDR